MVLGREGNEIDRRTSNALSNLSPLDEHRAQRRRNVKEDRSNN